MSVITGTIKPLPSLQRATTVALAIAAPIATRPLNTTGVAGRLELELASLDDPGMLPASELLASTTTLELLAITAAELLDLVVFLSEEPPPQAVSAMHITLMQEIKGRESFI